MDPVMTSDGHTYDRKSIDEWLQNHDTSPVTGGGAQLVGGKEGCWSKMLF